MNPLLVFALLAAFMAIVIVGCTKLAGYLIQRFGDTVGMFIFFFVGSFVSLTAIWLMGQGVQLAI